MDDKQEQSGTPAHTTQSTTPALSPSPVASSAQQPHAQPSAASSPSSAHSGVRPVSKASMPWTLVQAVELQRAVQALGLQEGEMPEWKAVGKLLHPPREAKSCWTKYAALMRSRGGRDGGEGEAGSGRGGSVGGGGEKEGEGTTQEDQDSDWEAPPGSELFRLQRSPTSLTSFFSTAVRRRRRRRRPSSS